MSRQTASAIGKSDLTASRVARHRLVATLVVGALIVLVSVLSLVIYLGIYNIAADAPHTQPVYWLLKMARERSIAVRAKSVVVPRDLADAERIASGAAQYDEMCSGCHLGPGMKRTEINQGLYPRAPELRRGSRLSPAEEFWVVKHGVKLTGMPAWGVTHDDDLLWDVVAFLRKMPELTAEQYKALVERSPKTHDEMMHDTEAGNGHRHDGQPHQ